MIRSLALALVAIPALASAQTPAAVSAADPYFKAGEAALARQMAVVPNTGKAKNVILFLGDGMGISTVTAARIYDGQQKGLDGESNSLSFEKLPYAALSKTYSHDTQVTDSAAGITAIMTGVKTRNKIIGLSGAAIGGRCESEKGTAIQTLAELAKLHGKAAGAVTTTRVTHATPAGAYAHTAYRDWEGDADMPAAAKQAGCKDIARQLIEAPEALRMDVIMGGGRSRFLPKGQDVGARADGRDLTAEWLKARGAGSAYVTTVDQLKAVPSDTRHVLGLFAPEHLPYEVERAKLGQGVPTLAEMATAAVDVLSRNPNGYFLMVEGGKIDMGSHLNNAKRTLTETVEFSKAIAAVLAKVDLKDTLVVVTADHSHGLVISGYSARNAPILGVAGNEGDPVRGGDGKAYTTLMFVTGPGGPKGTDTRRDPAKEDTEDAEYLQDSVVNLPSSAHAGEDVGVFADGPQAYLLRGVVEESYIFQVMRHAFGFDGSAAAKTR
ncbi:alkaline phosphatase [uncultured Caulobacter sp.]|uniref:alkaline phosphatase n=1 Tax=uncultured Caulobacter sp. TaxID=158749 RepID=UPI0026193056|nr:alkaline phosphatase [uncultured Caulobacter sp.]